MTKYELKKDTIELKNIGEYYPGCVLELSRLILLAVRGPVSMIRTVF